MAKKKKQQGHYCRICGEYKANEQFSGKGHARHICKQCQSLPEEAVSYTHLDVYKRQAETPGGEFKSYYRFAKNDV